MKRKDTVTALIKEGFSEKTLADLSDKQLAVLGERILGEQYNPNDINPVNIPKTDVNAITQAKQQKKQFVAYEGEMTEDKEEDKNKDKDDVVKKIKHKIEHCKDKKKIADLKDLLKRMKENDVKSSEMDIDEEEKPKFKSKTEWLKSKGIIKDDDDKKEETKETIAPASQPVSKPGEMGLDLTEWVNGVVGKHVHPFTSKSDILSLIKNKLDEQEVMEPETKIEIPDFLTYDAIKNAETAPAEPTTKPTTKPGDPNIKPNRPATPYQPGPGINPAPKAEKTD